MNLLASVLNAPQLSIWSRGRQFLLVEDATYSGATRSLILLRRVLHATADVMELMHGELSGKLGCSGICDHLLAFRHQTSSPSAPLKV